MKLLLNHKKKKQLNNRNKIITRLDLLLVEWKPAYEESSTKEEDIQRFNKIIVFLKSSRAWLQSINYKDSYKVITLIEKINESVKFFEFYKSNAVCYSKAIEKEISRNHKKR